MLQNICQPWLCVSGGFEKERERVFHTSDQLSFSENAEGGEGSGLIYAG